MVCQAQMHIHMNEELVSLMISEIPTVRRQCEEGDVTQGTHTHRPTVDEHCHVLLLF